MAATVQCYTWLKEYFSSHLNSTTIDEINLAFIDRNLAGVVFIATVMSVGVFGNILVLFIYISKFKVSNYRTYVIWLASLDLGNCALGMPFLMLYLTNQVRFPSQILCKIGRFVQNFTTVGSALILVVIAFDRYRKICRQFSWQLSGGQAHKCCGIVCILTLLLVWPAIILFGNFTVVTGINGVIGRRCFTEDEFRHRDLQKAFYVTLTCFCVTVTTILSVFYSLILYKMRNRIQRVKRLSAQESLPVDIVISGSRGNVFTKKTTMTLLVVTTVYVVSALPHYILVDVELFDTYFDCELTFTEGSFYYMFVWTILINNAANPIVYGFSDKRFRKELVFFFKTLLKQYHKSKLTKSSQTISTIS